MFFNEVFIEQEDKDRLVEILKEANSILDRYPYESCQASTVTMMSRAKSALVEAYSWCERLYVED